MLQIKVGGFKRINKKQARRVYESGEVAYILPCRTRFNNRWIAPYQAQKKNRYETIAISGFQTIIPRNDAFDTVINCYEYYNCNSELGKYAAYYIREGKQNENEI